MFKSHMKIEFRFNHNAEVLCEALGITKVRAEELERMLLKAICKHKKVSKVIEMILNANDVDIVEKMYMIFTLGLYEGFSRFAVLASLDCPQLTMAWYLTLQKQKEVVCHE